MNESAVKIQRIYRKRKDNAGWRALLDKMPLIRKAFMDDDALNAGAESNVLYGDMALAAREALRSSVPVREAIGRAWTAIIQPEDGMTRMVHAMMTRKIFLSLIILDAEAENDVDADLIDPVECKRAIEQDAAKDFRTDPQLMTEDDFRLAWFQLADLQTNGLAEDEYVEWIDSMLHTIRKQVGPHEWVWRDDEDLLDTLVQMTEAKRRRLTRSRAKAWLNAFREARPSGKHDLAQRLSQEDGALQAADQSNILGMEVAELQSLVTPPSLAEAQKKRAQRQQSKVATAVAVADRYVVRKPTPGTARSLPEDGAVSLAPARPTSHEPTARETTARGFERVVNRRQTQKPPAPPIISMRTPPPAATRLARGASAGHPPLTNLALPLDTEVGDPTHLASAPRSDVASQSSHPSHHKLASNAPHQLNSDECNPAHGSAGDVCGGFAPHSGSSLDAPPSYCRQDKQMYTGDDATSPPQTKLCGSCVARNPAGFGARASSSTDIRKRAGTALVEGGGALQPGLLSPQVPAAMPRSPAMDCGASLASNQDRGVESSTTSSQAVRAHESRSNTSSESVSNSHHPTCQLASVETLPTPPASASTAPGRRPVLAPAPAHRLAPPPVAPREQAKARPTSARPSPNTSKRASSARTYAQRSGAAALPSSAITGPMGVENSGLCDHLRLSAIPVTTWSVLHDPSARGGNAVQIHNHLFSFTNRIMNGSPIAFDSVYSPRPAPARANVAPTKHALRWGTNASPPLSGYKLISPRLAPNSPNLSLDSRFK